MKKVITSNDLAGVDYSWIDKSGRVAILARNVTERDEAYLFGLGYRRLEKYKDVSLNELPWRKDIFSFVYELRVGYEYLNK